MAGMAFHNPPVKAAREFLQPNQGHTAKDKKLVKEALARYEKRMGSGKK